MVTQISSLPLLVLSPTTTRKANQNNGIKDKVVGDNTNNGWEDLQNLGIHEMTTKMNSENS